MMHIEIEGIAVDIVLADELRLIGLVHRVLQRLAFGDELAAHIDVAGVGAHREGGDQRAFDQRMRVVAHDLAILAGSRLQLVRVDDEIMRTLRIDLLGHEGPFQAGGEARAAAAAQP